MSRLFDHYLGFSYSRRGRLIIFCFDFIQKEEEEEEEEEEEKKGPAFFIRYIYSSFSRVITPSLPLAQEKKRLSKIMTDRF